MTSPGETPEEASAVFLPTAAATMGHRWSSISEKTLSISDPRCTPTPPTPTRCTPTRCTTPTPTTAEPGSGVVFVPRIAVTAASPLPVDSDGSAFPLPAADARDRGEEQTRARPRDPRSGPRTPADNHDHVTTGHGISTGPRGHRVPWGLPLDDDDDDDADSHDDEGHLDLHSVSEGEECATPRASRQNFIELMMDRSPQVRRSMALRNSSFLRTPSRSDSDSASLVSSSDEDGPAPTTLDPLEHQWMLCASDAEWDGLSGLLAGEPALVLKRDFVTGFTCLHWAAKRGKPELLALLVNFARRHAVPVDVNARSSAGGYTPLHLAAMHNHAEVVKLLVGAYDADVELRDYSGKKASQYLAGGGASLDIQDIMVACGGGGFGGSDDSDGTPADAQPADGREGVRWRLSRVLQPHLKPLRLLGHSKSDVGARGGRGPRLRPGGGPRLRPVHRMSSLAHARPHKLQKRHSNRTSQVLTGTPAAAPPGSKPKSNLFH